MCVCVCVCVCECVCVCVCVCVCMYVYLPSAVPSIVDTPIVIGTETGSLSTTLRTAASPSVTKYTFRSKPIVTFSAPET